MRVNTTTKVNLSMREKIALSWPGASGKMGNAQFEFRPFSAPRHPGCEQLYLPLKSRSWPTPVDGHAD
jgi:hypothetical protein